MQFKRYIFGIVVAIAVAMASPALASYGASQNWFYGLKQQERFFLQADLVLIGEYQGLMDGKFGKGTYRALTSYQEKHGLVPDGILSQPQRDDLFKAAQAVYGRLGIALVDDAASGLTIYLPKSLLVQKTAFVRGNAYSSVDGQLSVRTRSYMLTQPGLSALYSSLSAAGSDRKVTYSKLNQKNFSVSGTQGDHYFYDRYYASGSRAVGYELRWTAGHRDIGTMLSIFLASFSYPTGNSKAASPQQPDAPPQAQGGAASEPTLISGSGFFFNTVGMAATNYHVAGECSKITVPGFGEARLIKGDPKRDLAVIELKGAATTPAATIRQKPAQLAEGLVLLGYPLADILNSSLNVSTGIVSAETGLAGEPDWFTTNAGIEPGNSGGPLLDQRGNVVGVAVAKVDDVKLLAQAGTSAPNVGFGISSTALLDFLKGFSFASVPDDAGNAARSPQDISRAAKRFTIQIICEKGAAGAASVSNSPSQASAAPPNAVPRLAVYTGLDFYGNDLSKGHATDLAQCATACADDNRCTAFTFNANPAIHRGPNCFLKSGVTRLEAYRNAISGLFLSAQDAAAPTYSFDAIDPTQDMLNHTDFPGHDLFDHPYAGISTLDACRRACIDNQSCRAFSFSTSAKQCWLKRGTPSSRAAQDVVSALKHSVSMQPEKVFNLTQ